MALTRVQATAKVNTLATFITIPFTAPPTVGNGIVVGITAWGASLATATARDNYGNPYVLDISRNNGNANAAVFSCARVFSTGASFTITVTKTSSTEITGMAIEVGSSASTGIGVDQTTSNTGSSITPGTGSTAALTNSEVFVVGIHGIGNSLASITVETVVPAWTQEFEQLPFAGMPGEMDSRILTGVSGTTQSCNWTLSGSNTWAACVAAYATDTTSDTPVRVTQAVVETVSQPVNVSVQVTQFAVEVLSANVAPVVTERVETFVWRPI